MISRGDGFMAIETLMREYINQSFLLNSLFKKINIDYPDILFDYRDERADHIDYSNTHYDTTIEF